MHVTATRTGAGRFGENSPPPLGMRSGAGKVSACAPHGSIGVERAEATSRRQRRKGEAIVARTSHCVDAGWRPLRSSTMLRRTGPQRQAIQCLHNSTNNTRKATRMIRQTRTSAAQDDIACHGNTLLCREIWGKFPAALGQAARCREGASVRAAWRYRG